MALKTQVKDAMRHHGITHVFLSELHSDAINA